MSSCSSKQLASFAYRRGPSFHARCFCSIPTSLHLPSSLAGTWKNLVPITRQGDSHCRRSYFLMTTRSDGSRQALNLSFHRGRKNLRPRRQLATYLFPLSLRPTHSRMNLPEQLGCHISSMLVRNFRKRLVGCVLRSEGTSGCLRLSLASVGDRAAKPAGSNQGYRGR